MCFLVCLPVFFPRPEMSHKKRPPHIRSQYNAQVFLWEIQSYLVILLVLAFLLPSDLIKSLNLLFLYSANYSVHRGYKLVGNIISKRCVSLGMFTGLKFGNIL